MDALQFFPITNERLLKGVLSSALSHALSFTQWGLTKADLYLLEKNGGGEKGFPRPPFYNLETDSKHDLKCPSKYFKTYFILSIVCSFLVDLCNRVLSNLKSRRNFVFYIFANF